MILESGGDQLPGAVESSSSEDEEGDEEDSSSEEETDSDEAEDKSEKEEDEESEVSTGFWNGYIIAWILHQIMTKYFSNLYLVYLLTARTGNELGALYFVIRKA